MEKHKKRQAVNIVYNHIVNNLKEYIIVSIVFIIGIVIGVIVVNNSNLEQKEEIQNYIQQFITNIKENQQIDVLALLKTVLLNDLILIIGLVVAGSTVIGIPVVYGIVVYKGFCLSYAIASILAVLGKWQGMIFAFLAVGLQNIIYIPCILALAVSGIKLYKSIIKDKKQENIKIEIIRHILFSSVISAIFLLGALIEVYVSTNFIIMFSKYL